MNIRLDTRDYVVREVNVEVDADGFLQSSIRLYHKDQNPIEAKIYKYAVKLGTNSDLNDLVGKRVSVASIYEAAIDCADLYKEIKYPYGGEIK